jgi:hypothetical protein
MPGNTEEIYENLNQGSTLPAGISTRDLPYTNTRTSRRAVKGRERSEVHHYSSTLSFTAEKWSQIFHLFFSSDGGN